MLTASNIRNHGIREMVCGWLHASQNEKFKNPKAMYTAINLFAGEILVYV